ncbi:MAG: thioredoxin family protein [Candidatus Thorarchaeota archaeon]
MFVKINIDENPKVAQHFGSSSIPTTLFIKNGITLGKLIGVMNYVALKQILDKFRTVT